MNRPKTKRKRLSYKLRYLAYRVTVAVICCVIATIVIGALTALLGVFAPNTTNTDEESVFVRRAPRDSVAGHHDWQQDIPDTPYGYNIYYSQYDIQVLAQTIAGEYCGPSYSQKLAVAWCVCNRVDTNAPGFQSVNTIAQVCQQTLGGVYMFNGYQAKMDWNPTQEYLDIATDVLVSWAMEKDGIIDTSSSRRILPPDVIYFFGDGTINWFSSQWHGGSLYTDLSICVQLEER